MNYRPVLLDFEQVIGRLDMPRPVARRLQRQRAFARPSLTFNDEPDWSWKHVKQWARHPRRSLSLPAPVAPDIDPVDTTMIAARLGMPKRIILHWHRSRRMAVPDYNWGGRSVWLWSTIEAWVIAHSRNTTPPGAEPSAELDPIGKLEELSVSLRNLRYPDLPPPPGVSRHLLGTELSKDRQHLDGLRDRMDDIAAFIARMDGEEKVEK